LWSAKGTNLLLQKHKMKRIKCSSSIVVLCMSTSMSCKLAFESKKGGHKPFPQHVENCPSVSRFGSCTDETGDISLLFAFICS